MMTPRTSRGFHKIRLFFCFAFFLGRPFAAGEDGRSLRAETTKERETSEEVSTRGHSQQLRRLLELQGYGGDPDPSRFPLQLCEGDCDSDSDCDAGLVCFERDAFMAVPGCEGGESFSSLSDFCIEDPNATTKTPSTAPTARSLQPSLSSSPSALPSISTAPSISSLPTSSPVTMEPTQYVPKLLEVVGNDGSPGSAFPLGLCQGDCDDDSDCDWGLYCVQRSNRDDPVPGCDISASSDRDFCAPLPPDRLIPGSFRLKLYWEEGYMWQDEPIETFWCATFDYDGYPGSGECWYGDETKSCNPEELYISTCSRDEQHQAFVFVPVSNNTVVIQLGNGEDKCLERLKRAIYLRPCDANNPLQRWFPLNGSFQSGDKFELSQKDFESQCISNAHHPKPGKLLLNLCRQFRDGLCF